MELEGKRVAVLTEDHFDEQEFIYVNIRMREAGADVTIVAPKGDHEYHSKVGWPKRATRPRPTCAPPTSTP